MMNDSHKVPRLEFLTCLKVISRKVLNGLKQKGSLSKGILKRKTGKIFVSHLLELWLQKYQSANVCILILEVLCNIYWTYCNVWIKTGHFEEHCFRSARQEN